MCVDTARSMTRNPENRPRQLILVIAVVAGVLIGVGTPTIAAAAPANVEYSRDGGSTWSASPPPFLFSTSVRFVPGDVATENVLIRSLRTDPTFIQVSLAHATTDDFLLESALTVEGSDADGAGLPPTTFDALLACQAVVPDRVLAEGEMVSVSLTLRVSDTLTGRQAQDSAGRFDLALALSDPGPGIAPNGCTAEPVHIPGVGSPSDGETASGSRPADSVGLAFTGAAVAYPALITAVIALGVGWIFVIVGRCRWRGADHAE